MDIDAFKKKKKLENLGIPAFTFGEKTIKETVYEFLILKCYADPNPNRNPCDFFKKIGLKEYNLKISEVLMYSKLIINVLEYIHEKGYVYADIQSNHILIIRYSAPARVFLVNYGKACKFDVSQDFKPVPGNAHYGTIEYTSRDAHQGVPSFRGDIESLAYNIIEWSGGKLPWVIENMLGNPDKVQESKEEFMKSIDESLETALAGFALSETRRIRDLFKLISEMKPQVKPDYNRIRNILTGTMRIKKYALLKK